MNGHEVFSIRDEARSGTHGPIYALIGVLAVLATACSYLFWRVHRLATGTSEWKATTSQEISALRETVAANDSTLCKNMEALQADLAEAGRQATTTAVQARLEALKHADQRARQLADERRKEASRLMEVKQNATTPLGLLYLAGGSTPEAVLDCHSWHQIPDKHTINLTVNISALDTF